MREKFVGYYPPTPAEMGELWDVGIVAVDANALLNAYRYTPRTRDDFLDLLQAFGNRLWLPYQAAKEFHANRLQVVTDLRAAPAIILDGINKAKAAFREATDRFRYHPELDTKQLLREYDEALAPVTARLERARLEALQAAVGSPHNDPILERITAIFAGKVSDGFSESELEQIYSQGRARYERKIPPGFKDSEKGEPARFGDLVMWMDILREAKSSQLPMIFVTDDRKEDWWWEHHGKTVGPRMELVGEFAQMAGKRVHLYTPEAFLRVAKDRRKSDVSEQSIDEAENVALLERERARSVIARRLRELQRERGRLAATLATAEAAPGSHEVDAIQNMRELLRRIETEDHQSELTMLTLRKKLTDSTDVEDHRELIRQLDHEESRAEERSERRAALVARIEATSRDATRALSARHIDYLRSTVARLDSEAADLQAALRSLPRMGRDESDEAE